MAGREDQYDEDMQLPRRPRRDLPQVPSPRQLGVPPLVLALGRSPWPRRLDMLVYVDDNASKFVPDEYGWQLHRDICDHVNTRFKIKADANGERYGEEAKSFLGCHIVRDWDAHTVSVSLPAKVRALPQLLWP